MSTKRRSRPSARSSPWSRCRRSAPRAVQSRACGGVAQGNLSVRAARLALGLPRCLGRDPALAVRLPPPALQLRRDHAAAGGAQAAEVARRSVRGSVRGRGSRGFPPRGPGPARSRSYALRFSAKGPPPSDTRSAVAIRCPPLRRHLGLRHPDAGRPAVRTPRSPVRRSAGRASRRGQAQAVAMGSTVQPMPARPPSWPRSRVGRPAPRGSADRAARACRVRRTATARRACRCRGRRQDRSSARRRIGCDGIDRRSVRAAAPVRACSRWICMPLTWKTCGRGQWKRTDGRFSRPGPVEQRRDARIAGAAPVGLPVGGKRQAQRGHLGAMLGLPAGQHCRPTGHRPGSTAPAGRDGTTASRAERRMLSDHGVHIGHGVGDWKITFGRRIADCGLTAS